MRSMNSHNNNVVALSKIIIGLLSMNFVLSYGLSKLCYFVCIHVKLQHR